MSLSIKIKKSKILGVLDKDDQSVDEAIFSIYPDYANYEFNLWLSPSLRTLLCFRGDLSSIYNDIIYMLNDIESNKDSFTVWFLSSSFTAVWYCTVTTKHITIKPRWTSVMMFYDNVKVNSSDYRMYEDLITVEKSVFISEWNKLLKGVKEDLTKVGYSEELKGYDYLKKL